ncbi:MAG TPA: hypothetical protein VF937_15755 [Chloroflexota bacterium]
MVRFVVAWLGLGLALCSLSLACGPTVAAPTPTPAFDAFAVVRATSQAAYASGKAHLDAGEYLLACVDLDTARTNDPDNRPEIEQALEQALQRCLTPPPQATSAPSTALQRTIVVATLPLASATTSSASNPTGGTPLPAGRATSGASASPVASADLVAWSDPQGRFSIGAPSDWVQVDQPQSLFGTPVVQFHDPSGRVEMDVAVDPNSRAVSPELYAASMELAMQQQVPGYASEQVQPGSTAGNPSIRRVFTFTQRDASGQEHQARGFEVTVVKGSTPYLISGSAPANEYEQYSPTFDRIVDSFRFS